MSTYNSYAQDLNTAFLKAKEETDKALAEYKEAEKAVQADNDLTPREQFQGDMKYRIAQHQATLKLCQENLNKVLRDTWAEFYRTRDSLTTALQEQVGRESAANVDDVDINGMLLLHSNILNSYDLQAMCDKYQGNATMLRLIGSKADEMAKATQDRTERTALIMIRSNCRDAAQGPSIMDRWDVLCRESSIYSKEGETADAAYISQLSNHWNDATVQDGINSF